MDIFDIKTIRKYDECTDTYYVSDDVKHTEDLYFDLIKGSEKKRHYFIKKGIITYGWMQLAGYGDVVWEEKGDNEHPVYTLEKIAKLIDPPKYNARLFEKMSEDQFLDTANEMLDLFGTAVGKAPALGTYYPMLYRVIKKILSCYDGSISSDEGKRKLATSIRIMSFAFRTALVGYDEVRKYIDEVFIKPQSYGITLSPDKLVENYKNYYRLYRNNGDNSYASSDFYSMSTSEKVPNGGFQVKVSDDPGWEAFIKDRQEQETDGIAVFTINQMSHIAISQLMHDNRTIRKCAQCGRYFKVRFNSTQECCTRQYKDTKYACNEYISRQAAKDRFFEHPIHAEYNTAYNRLYGRIRRGKVPKDTPLNTSLKELHDKYYEMYEAAPEKNRKKILDEYIEKCRELLG